MGRVRSIEIQTTSLPFHSNFSNSCCEIARWKLVGHHWSFDAWYTILLVICYSRHTFQMDYFHTNVVVNMSKICSICCYLLLDERVPGHFVNVHDATARHVFVFFLFFKHFYVDYEKGYFQFCQTDMSLQLCKVLSHLVKFCRAHIYFKEILRKSGHLHPNKKNTSTDIRNEPGVYLIVKNNSVGGIKLAMRVY